MPWTNYHSHNHYCDGSHEPEAYVQKALEEGIHAYGFSSHSPLPFETKWNMKATDFDSYLQDIQTLIDKYNNQIQLYTSLEIDYIKDVVGPKDFADKPLDYTICSIHYAGQLNNGEWCEVDGSHNRFLEGLNQIFNGDIKAFVTHYYQQIIDMLENDRPNVLGHFDRIRKQDEDGALFDTNESWYKDLIERTLQAAKRNDVIIEVNTKDMYRKGKLEPYPQYDVLKRMKELSIPIMLNSDTHRPTDITGAFEEVADTLLKIGFRELMVYYDHKWQSMSFDQNGVKLPVNV